MKWTTVEGAWWKGAEKQKLLKNEQHVAKPVGAVEYLPKHALELQEQ